MKILQVIFGMCVGGAETLLGDLSAELLRRGHDVTVCCIEAETVGSYGTGLHLLPEGVRYVNLGSPSGYAPRGVWRLLSLVRRERPDVVHAHLCSVMLLPLTVCLPGVRCVYTLHSAAEVEFASLAERLAMRLTARLGRVRVAAISEAVAASYTACIGRRPSRLVVNGRRVPAPTARLADVAREVAAMRRHADDLVCVHVGRCHPDKQQALLLDVFGRLVDEGFHAVLVVVGGGFEALAASCACPAIHFVGQQTDVVDYLAQGDLFCLASRAEGLPLSLLEAMTCGLVPVCTPAGGVPEVVTDGVTGFLASDASAEAYERTLRRALATVALMSAAEREAWRCRLRALVAGRYSMEACADGYLRLYTDPDCDAHPAGQ